MHIVHAHSKIRFNLQKHAQQTQSKCVSQNWEPFTLHKMSLESHGACCHAWQFDVYSCSAICVFCMPFFSESLFLVIIMVGRKKETYKKRHFLLCYYWLRVWWYFPLTCKQNLSFTDKVWNRKMLSYSSPQLKGALGNRVWAFPFGHRQTIFLHECDTHGKRISTEKRPPHAWPLLTSVGHFLYWCRSHGRSQSTKNRTILRRIGLHYITKVSTCEPEIRPASNIPPWSPFSHLELLRWLPSMRNWITGEPK